MNGKPMKPQVNKSHYLFARYVGFDRWASYHTQLKETLLLAPESVMEIGPGDGVYRNYLLSQTEVRYQSLDIDPELKPDIVGSVTAIPLPDNAVDYVMAFEVLEHLPFDQFSIALKEIARVARHGAIVSLPHFGPPVKLLFKLPFLPEISFAFKIPYLPVHHFNDQHYWELGKKGYSVSRILRELNNFFVVEKHFVPFENQYHHFFVLTKHPRK
jgi:SAM-dependent methyltransferase